MAASTALPELPMPNLGSPRVRAAMKMLGVLPKDLEKEAAVSAIQIQDPDHFPGGQTRYDLFERKRRNLLLEVQRLAEKGLEDPALAKVAVQRDNSAFMEEVLRKEKANMEVMQRMAKKDVQKLVIQELEAKLILQNSAQKQEESRQRLQLLTKERDEKLKTVRKVAEKKWEKSKEVRERAMRMLADEAKEVTEKLNKASARADQKFVEIALERQASRERNEGKRSERAVRQERFEQGLQREREQKYEEIVAKHAAKLEKLEEALSLRQSHSELILERQQKSMEKVKTFQEHRQAEAETKYWETLARHEKAQQIREERSASRTKDFVVRNKKAKEAHKQRFDKLMQELEYEAKKREQELAKATEPLSRSFSEPQLSPSAAAAAVARQNLVELVKENRERVRRARCSAIESQIAQIAQMRERTQALVDAKANADRRRMDVLRNCGLEKTYLTEKVDRIRDAGPAKLLKLIEGQDLEPDAAKRISELLEKLGLQSLFPTREEDEAQRS